MLEEAGIDYFNSFQFLRFYKSWRPGDIVELDKKIL